MSSTPEISRAGPFEVVKYPSGAVSIHVDKEGKEQINDLLQRAMNCWPNALPHTKELSDLVRYGKVLQNYHTQR